MSATAASVEAARIEGNLAFACGTWAAGGTHTKPTKITTGLGELFLCGVYLTTAANRVNATPSHELALRYGKNKTQNGTAENGAIGIYETVGSGDAGEWWAIGKIA